MFDGRGHIEASYEYRKEEGILSLRSSYMNLVGVAGSVPGTASPGTAQNPYELYTNVRQAQYPFSGLIRNGVYANQTFRTDGVLSPFVAGTPTGTNGLQIGGDGGYYDSSLLAPMEGHQFSVASNSNDRYPAGLRADRRATSRPTKSSANICSTTAISAIRMRF